MAQKSDQERTTQIMLGFKLYQDNKVRYLGTGKKKYWDLENYCRNMHQKMVGPSIKPKFLEISV